MAVAAADEMKIDAAAEQQKIAPAVSAAEQQRIATAATEQQRIAAVATEQQKIAAAAAAAAAAKVSFYVADILIFLFLVCLLPLIVFHSIVYLIDALVHALLHVCMYWTHTHTQCLDVP